MSDWRESVLSFSALPEVAALLLAAEPAWVWARDGSRLLWANPAGGARVGALSFAEVAPRRWPHIHPLRREVESLVRTLPEKGTLARLRIADEPRAFPVACRCRRIRASEWRGILVVAVEGGDAAPVLSQLASFFSSEDVSAVIIDDAGTVLAGSAPEGLSATSGEAYAELPCGSNGAPKLFLWRSAPAGGSLGEDAEAEVITAPVEQPTPAIQTEPDRPTTLQARGHQALPPEAPREIVAEGAERAASEGKARHPRAASPGKPQNREPAPKTRRNTAATADPAAEHAGTDEPRETVPRTIMAGRVAHELSRKPVRFLWQTDGSDRFLFVSPGLAQVVGRNAEIVGERWPDAAARLRLDPSSRISRALAQRDTWSGQIAWWPVEGSNVRVPAELTALPIFGSDHSFQGYRGFGVLKPAEALMPAAFEARFGTAEQKVPPLPEQLPPYEEAIATTPANVVPIRADLERISEHGRLTPQERSAFEEIAAALHQRVVNEPLAAEHSRAEPAEPEAGEPAATSRAEPSRAERPVFELFRRLQGAVPDSARAAEPGEAAGAPAPLGSYGEQAAGPAGGGRGEYSEAEPAPSAPEESPAAGADIAAQPAEHAPSEPALQESAARRAELSAAEARRLEEITAILDAVTDGVIVLDHDGTIESVNSSAEALFGLDTGEMQGTDFTELLTLESRQSACDYLAGLRENGVASLLNEGREVAAIAGAGSIPLFMTMGRISGRDGDRFCAVFRDITQWKRTEAELVAARRAAEAASNQKSEFLARVSHEIRTPLNAIIGFAEVMIEERFGPVENDRYREYLRDIRTSGEHVVSIVNDLLDISKIEAGKLDLNFQAVPLNELVRECIGLMQPQANRAHVVLRTSLSKEVPAIVADQRTLRQIILNLLSNSVKFTGPGGQVITSTSLAETGEAVLRIRDTGEGMSAEELARALEPFRQIATAPLADRTGTGLGLPLTKALVEANRASLAIRSARGEGTVVTITFPPTRVLSE